MMIELTQRDQIILIIARHWLEYDMIPTQQAVRMEIDHPGKRCHELEVKQVYAYLYALGWITGPGKHTGRWYSTKAGRRFFEGFEGLRLNSL